MKPLLDSGIWLNLDSVDSTQNYANRCVEQNLSECPSVVFTTHQTAGRGRFDRKWLEEPGSNIAMTMVFKEYADHPKPWLIGMSVAAAAAKVLNCQLQWPNDLVLAWRKLGGILTEIITSSEGTKIPVVGIGVNLNTMHFPTEIATRAISLAQHFSLQFDPLAISEKIVHQLEELPEPDEWHVLKPIWEEFDATRGKQYKTNDGKIVIARGIGDCAQLIGSVDGKEHTVFAADAFFDLH